VIRPGDYAAAVRCPICGHDDTRVIDSRPADQGVSIRRRRSCVSCGHRFTTYERNAPVVLVRKRNGKIEPFAPEKLQRGVEAAVAGREVSAPGLAQLLEEIEAAAATHAGPMPTDQIGLLILNGLRGMDEVSYLRFASVYKGFEVAEDFEREVAALDDSSS
jgi:transcriptional repressor NrdR